MEFKDIETAMTDNEELSGQVLEHFKGKGFVIRTTDEDNTFKKNAISQGAESLFNEKIGDKTKEFYTQLDNDVFSVTGIQRNQDEKSYDYNKRVHQSNLEKINSLEATNKELEAKLKSGDVDSVWKNKYESLEKEAKQNILLKQEEINKLKGVADRYTTSEQINRIFAPISAQFKKDLPGYFKTHQDHVLNEVISKAKQKDGDWIMTKDGDNELHDQNLNPIKVEDYLKQQFKDVFDEKRIQNGTGTGQVDVPNGQPGELVVPKNIDTREKLQEYLAEMGIPRRTNEWNEAYQKAVKENNITKLA